jgi:fumarate reductase flavoprotein subunit
MTIGIAPTTPADPVSGKGVLINYAGGVLLNRAGYRFCDESQLYNDISAAALRQNDPTIIQIYDASIRADYSKTMWGRVLTGYAEYRAGDLDGLLAQIDGIDRAQARASIDAYNAGVAAGADPAFGRRHLAGNSGTPVTIATPPFYGLVTVPGTTHFNGGLKVDGSLHVVDVFGAPIDGLFAAGEIVGGFHGNGYLSGTHVGMALIFGQVAGQNASAL